VVCRGVRYGTIRRKYAPRSGVWTGLCLVRQPAGSPGGRVVLNLWEIRLEDHNPSPFRTVAWTQEGEWVPVAVTGHVPAPEERPGRPVDYLLLEAAVEGKGEAGTIEVADLALYDVSAFAGDPVT